MTTTTKLLLEFAGTAVFVVSIFLSGGNALLIGGTLAALIWIAARHTWCHFNPAVSVAMAIRGSIPWSILPLEVGAQLAGAGVGYSMYKLIRSLN